MINEEIGGASSFIRLTARYRQSAYTFTFSHAFVSGFARDIANAVSSSDAGNARSGNHLPGLDTGDECRLQSGRSCG